MQATTITRQTMEEEDDAYLNFVTNLDNKSLAQILC